MGKKYTIVRKDENGITSDKISASEVKELRSEKEDHMCWKDCAYAYVGKCPKIADIKKKSIDQYDFVKKGYQIFNNDGELDTFSVTECERYKYKEPTKKEADLKELNWLRAGIITGYFNAESVDEANMIQYELVKRGQLIPNGLVISDKKYMELKQKVKRKKRAH